MLVDIVGTAHLERHQREVNLERLRHCNRALGPDRIAVEDEDLEDRLFSLQNLSFFPPCPTMSYHVLPCLLMKDMIGHDRTLSSMVRHGRTW